MENEFVTRQMSFDEIEETCPVCGLGFPPVPVLSGSNLTYPVPVHVGLAHAGCVSPVLRKVSDRGELERVEGFGPRGGHGYRRIP